MIMETLKSARKKADTPANNSELTSLLRSRKIDTQRYEPIGAGFYHQYEDCFNASVICIDRKKFAAGEPYLIKIMLDDFTHEEYMAFRKKFEVIINPEYRSYYSLNVNSVLSQDQLSGL